MKNCVTVSAVVALATTAFAADKLEPDDLPPPQPEVVSSPAAVDPPAVPGFELPPSTPGFRGPKELRVRGKSALGTELKVRGYVTWVSDCPAQLATSNPTATREQILAAIDKDPSLCPAPKFYVGDTKTTPQDRSIWVVDTPRAPTRNERAQLTKNKQPLAVVHQLAVGDFVTVTGQWTTKSSRNEHNTNGLLIFRSVERTPPPAPAPAAAAAPAEPAEPEITVVTKAPLRAKVDVKVRNKSADHLNACVRGFGQRMYDPAIAECQAAIKAWDGNHLAWYTLGSSHMAKGEWPQAQAAVERAVTLRPDQGMYQLYHGISIYEAVPKAAAAGAAAAPGAAGATDAKPAAPTLEAARDALRRAAKLNPDLWRAHFYLGKVYRDLDDAKRAAEQFTLTIKTHPAYRFGYIALIELYRRWDYVDQALAVAQLATTQVPAAETWELWFQLGMIHDARRASDQAIDAFTRALAGKPDDAQSKFQRGQVYFRKGDHASARRDFEDLLKSADPAVASLKPLAQQFLAQIAAAAKQPAKPQPKQ